MQGDPRARTTQRLMHMLRPEQAGIAARAAGAWLKSSLPTPYVPLKLRGLADSTLTLGRLGALEVRLAQDKRDIRRAQKLRYKVFYQNGVAIADAATLLARRDKDAYDKICDHLMVIDHAAPPTLSGNQPVVGTYRLLRQEMADRHDGFYSANEFDLSAMRDRHPGLNFLELGRACVIPKYRTKRTVELLWRGIWNYVCANKVDVMIGCASLNGTDPARLALPLSFLHHHARAPAAWRVRAHESRFVEMNRMAKEAIDPKAALRELPPLIKGYLRVGATVGDGAVIDHAFGTTDVLIIMPVAAIRARYVAHFGADQPRAAGVT